MNIAENIEVINQIQAFRPNRGPRQKLSCGGEVLILLANRKQKQMLKRYRYMSSSAVRTFGRMRVELIPGFNPCDHGIR